MEARQLQAISQLRKTAEFFVCIANELSEFAIDCFQTPERSVTAPRLKRMWDKYVVYPTRARRVHAAAFGAEWITGPTADCQARSDATTRAAGSAGG